MSKTYSAGIVTAYGAAKRAGYQGTYEDFCRQQAQYAENAQTVEQAKNTAVSAANTATAKAGEAITAATDAQTAKIQTEQATSQALTDISTARSDAIIAVQTEGATQTANARAQAQAAAQSATTASTKASEASASATSAGQSATNAAASATNAASSASAAQGVLESIPADYSDLSEDVDQLKADLSDYKPIINVSNLLKDPLFRKPFSDNWNSIGTPTISETDKLNNNVTLTYGGSQVQITQDILLSELVSGTYYVSCKTTSGEHLKIQVTARRKTNYYSGYLVNTEDGSATFNLDIEAIQTADPLITKLTVAFILAHNGSVTFTQPYLGISDAYNGFWNKNFADLDDIAKYPVKSAEQLISDKRTTDKVPYKYRASQSGKSDRAYDMIVGGTVCFNQLIQNGDFSDGTTGFIVNNGSVSVSNGVLIFTASSGSGRKNFMTGNNNTAPDAIVGHKYFYSFYVKVSTTGIGSTFAYSPLTNNGSVFKALTANTDTNIIGIRACTQSGKVRLYVYPWGVDSSATDGTEICSAHDFMIIDLTSMFGVAIADHIYNLEQSQAGAGVALFRAMFPNEYYPYNAGELISVEGLSAHVMRDADDNIVGSYPLDSTLTLRGVPVLKDGKVEFDGDTYKADGTMTKRYAERAYQSGDESLANAITDGTNTVYKLSAPTTKIATPYTSPQVVSPYGAEEYISETVCPVGHVTEYPDNLRAKIDGLPWDLSMIAPVEVTYTATRNYTTGQLLIVDNVLYKVTANIANGGTITPNSNVVATTLSEVIASLS